MSQTVVITGVGRDRVGIVAELTAVLFKSGCNLLDSSMTLLRGEFAIILMASLGSAVGIKELQEELLRVQEKMSFTLQIRALSEDELENAEKAFASGRIYIVSVYGADKPGIVANITARLAELNFNITDVETTRTAPAATVSDSDAKSVFIMIIEGSAPAELSRARLENELRDIATSMGIDVTVQEMEVVDY